MLRSVDLTAQQERHGKTRIQQLKGSDGEVSSTKDSVYRRRGDCRVPSRGGRLFSRSSRGHGGLDLDGNDQEEDSSIVWDDERLEEDSMGDSGK